MQSKHLPDTQNTTDVRNIVINEVGIKDILHPINFINRDQESLPTVANFTMTVRLPENVKVKEVLIWETPRSAVTYSE